MESTSVFLLYMHSNNGLGIAPSNNYKHDHPSYLHDSNGWILLWGMLKKCMFF